MPKRTADQIADELTRMDRAGLIRKLREMDCGFELDFTGKFLNTISIERLRHITLAASLQAAQKS